MLPLLEFVFRSIWTFLGTIVLIGVILNGIAEIVQSWRFKQDPKPTKDEQ